MIERAIQQRIAEGSKTAGNNEISVEQILKDVSQKELYDFIVRQAQYNPEIRNTILLEFAHKTNTKDTNSYTQIIRKSLDGLSFDYEDISHDEDCIEIDVLDQWLNKAKNHADTGNISEAILICKACIEEYATWYKECDIDVLDYMDPIYQEKPFDILMKILAMQGTDCKSLFEYCKSEMIKSKYKRTEMYDGFTELLMKLSILVGSDDFIALQGKLLHEIQDKKSWEAQKILKKKIDFFRSNNQPDKAWDVIKGNLQIETFREELTKKLIAENQLHEAKKTINELYAKYGTEIRHASTWNEFRLQIAKKENDTPMIRSVSRLFIEKHFDAKYYEIYKSSFSKEEWTEEVEKIIQNYAKQDKNQWFKSSVSDVADVLQAEKQNERLMKYIEKHLSVDNLEKYHTGFSAAFPEQTLALFRKVVNDCAQNTGREHYERIVALFGKMVKIEGGRALVKEILSQYRVLYKNRRAMLEIMTGFEKKIFGSI